MEDIIGILNISLNSDVPRTPRCIAKTVMAKLSITISNNFFAHASDSLILIQEIKT